MEDRPYRTRVQKRRSQRTKQLQTYSLLPIISKVLERIVHNMLYRFLTPWLKNNQSSFRKKDRTVLQLTWIIQEWSNVIDKGEYVTSVFFDLSKAFDKVWHEGLLAKLQAAGIKGSAFPSKVLNHLRCC